MSTLLTRKRDRIDDLADKSARGNSLTRDAIRRLSRNPVAILGAVIVLYVLRLLSRGT